MINDLTILSIENNLLIVEEEIFNLKIMNQYHQSLYDNEKIIGFKIKN